MRVLMCMLMCTHACDAGATGGVYGLIFSSIYYTSSGGSGSHGGGEGGGWSGGGGGGGFSLGGAVKMGAVGGMLFGLALPAWSALKFVGVTAFGLAVGFVSYRVHAATHARKHALVRS